METIAQIEKPSVFEYGDYRKFLADAYTYMKSRHRQFSFRYFSARAGFSSPNFLKLVIEGKRNLSDESIHRFALALKLSRSESEFFGHLVRFTQSKTPSERADNAQAMMSTKAFAKIHPLRQAEYAYYACWYYIPVRELVALPGFQEDGDWIAERMRPRIAGEDARRALRDLEALGLLVRDSLGRLTQAQRTVATESEVSSSAISRYHKEMMGLASDSIDCVPRHQREISAACVPVSKATAAKMKTLIQEFRQKLLAIADEDTAAPDTVYQINMQLFPLSDWEEK